MSKLKSTTPWPFSQTNTRGISYACLKIDRVLPFQGNWRRAAAPKSDRLIPNWSRAAPPRPRLMMDPDRRQSRRFYSIAPAQIFFLQNRPPTYYCACISNEIALSAGADGARRTAMPLPRDSNGDAATAAEGAPSLASNHAPLAELLLDKPRRSLDWLGFWRGGPTTSSAAGGVAVVWWGSVRSTCREWVRHPMNVALLIWLLCVGASGGMLVLLLLGLLDGAFPAPAARSHWVEVDNQVLNALFTLMSLYQHPALFHHLFLLCRWRLPADAADLRAAYCGGTPRRGERAHMAVVVALLHLTIVCQYALCWLYWCFTERSRPELAEDVFCAVGVAAPLVAVVYTVCSPLGRSEPSGDLDAPSVTEQFPKTSPHANAVVVVVEPEWAGGMFDCAGGGEAAAGCCLSLSCTFCVFGWNAERLGFGNACVHAATFLLLCFAPLWVLGVTALRVHDAAVGDVVGGAGVLLCAGGLLYGGYWRIEMRRKFGLPGSAVCCGSKSATDYASWLFCWPCALAQEVRTASLYHIEGESFFHRKDAAVSDHEPLLPPRHRADPAVAPGTSAISASEHDGPSSEHLVVVVHDEMVPPPVVQVVAVGDDDTCEECNAVHVQEEIERPVPTSAIDQRLSGGREEDGEAEEDDQCGHHGVVAFSPVHKGIHSLETALNFVNNSTSRIHRCIGQQ